MGHFVPVVVGGGVGGCEDGAASTFRQKGLAEQTMCDEISSDYLSSLCALCLSINVLLRSIMYCV